MIVFSILLLGGKLMNLDKLSKGCFKDVRNYNRSIYMQYTSNMQIRDAWSCIIFELNV